MKKSTDMERLESFMEKESEKKSEKDRKWLLSKLLGKAMERDSYEQALEVLIKVIGVEQEPVRAWVWHLMYGS